MSMVCNKCKQPVEPGDKFCPHCGAPVQQVPTAVQQCPKCNHENPANVSFCENCGTSLKANEAAAASSSKPRASDPKTFTSAGNYSGKMVKGKSSKSWKRLKTILLIIGVVAVIAFVIWYKTDPNAKETMGNILFGVVIMTIFGFFIWRKNRKMTKKERIRRKREADLDDLYDDDNFDDDDDDDFDD